MLLFYVYVASFVIGGILLAASLFLGGQEHGDVDSGDAHVDFGGHDGLDGGHDFGDSVDVDAGGDLDVGPGAAGAAATELAGSEGVSFSDFWLPFLSVRFWVFFLSFFGLTGLTLTLLALFGHWVTLFSALGMGVATGFTAAFLIQRLKQDEVGVVGGIDEYQGKEGIVLLPIEPGTRGKVRIEICGRTIDLAASSSVELARGRRVLVIEIQDSEAVVEPIDR